MRIFLYGRLLLGFAILSILQPSFTGAYGADSTASFPSSYLTFQPPSVGGTYTDPNFGTVVKRLTNALATPNADAGGNLVSITTEYSTVVPFNRDNSRVLISHQSYFGLYDGAGNHLSNLPFEINTGSEPRWSRTDPNILYYRFVNQLKQYNVSTGATSILRTFSEYSSISGKGESDISYDGNHFVLAGDNRYVFVYEVSTDTKGPAFDTAGKGFDSVYITPSNNVTITWLRAGTDRFSGIELFDRNMNFLRQAAHAGGHMDVTRDADGSDVLVWTNSDDPLPLAGCDNGFVKIKLATGQQTCLLTLDWSLAVHISGADDSGWVFAETYAPADPVPSTSAWVPYANEILQIKLDGTEVRRLLHHRSRPFNSYTWQPRVSASRDGSRFVYDSNYGLQAILGHTREYSDVYLGSVPGATPAPASTTPTTTATEPAPTVPVVPTPSPTPEPAPTTAQPPVAPAADATTTTANTTTTRREQNGAGVAFGSGWYSLAQGIHSGGSAAEAMDAGSRVTFTFTGTAVRWIGLRDEWSGIAKVFLDGQLVRTVDTYASPARIQDVIWGISGLAPTAHSLVIEVTGSRSAASAGAWVWVDAFDVDASSGSPGGSPASGTTITSPAPAPTPAPRKRTTRR